MWTLNICKVLVRPQSSHFNPSETGARSTEIFDGVLIGTGHHVEPYVAHFNGEEAFEVALQVKTLE